MLLYPFSEPIQQLRSPAASFSTSFSTAVTISVFHPGDVLAQQLDGRLLEGRSLASYVVVHFTGLDTEEEREEK